MTEEEKLLKSIFGSQRFPCRVRTGWTCKHIEHHIHKYWIIAYLCGIFHFMKGNKNA